MLRYADRKVRLQEDQDREDLLDVEVRLRTGRQSAIARDEVGSTLRKTHRN